MMGLFTVSQQWRKKMGAKSPIYKVKNPITWWIPNQDNSDELNQARYKEWLKMQARKRRHKDGNKK